MDVSHAVLVAAKGLESFWVRFLLCQLRTHLPRVSPAHRCSCFRDLLFTTKFCVLLWSADEVEPWCIVSCLFLLPPSSPWYFDSLLKCVCSAFCEVLVELRGWFWFVVLFWGAIILLCSSIRSKLSRSAKCVQLPRRCQCQESDVTQQVVVSFMSVASAGGHASTASPIVCWQLQRRRTTSIFHGTRFDRLGPTTSSRQLVPFPNGKTLVIVSSSMALRCWWCVQGNMSRRSLRPALQKLPAVAACRC